MSTVGAGSGGTGMGVCDRSGATPVLTAEQAFIDDFVAAGGFGVGVIFNTVIDPARGIYCLDISGFDGVVFWAKAATAGSRIALNFILPQTNPVTTDSPGRPNGGDCRSNCNSHPNAPLMLTSNWAPYAVRFAQASGGTAPLGSVIQELEWTRPDSNWDFSIDEIAFLRGTPPSGPVGAPGDGGL